MGDDARREGFWLLPAAHEDKVGRVQHKLSAEQRAALAGIVETGPAPAIHGVVRWRRCDLVAKCRPPRSTTSRPKPRRPRRRSSLDAHDALDADLNTD